MITTVLLFPLLLPPHLTLTRPRWPNKYINKYYIREVMNAWLPTKRRCAAAHLSYHNTSEENCLHCLHALVTIINSHHLKINPKTHEIIHSCLRYCTDLTTLTLLLLQEVLCILLLAFTSLCVRSELFWLHINKTLCRLVVFSCDMNYKQLLHI